MERIKKKWGEEIVVVSEPEYAMKFMKMHKSFFTSKHFHPTKKETLYVQKGSVNVVVWKENSSEGVFALSKGNQLTVHPRTIHQIVAIEDTVIIEVSTQPAHDSVRLNEAEQSARGISSKNGS